MELTPVDGDGKEEKDTTTSKSSHDTRAVFKLFLNVHYGSWLTTCFFVGVCNGVIWGFLFWHLENLGIKTLFILTSGALLNSYGCQCTIYYLSMRQLAIHILLNIFVH